MANAEIECDFLYQGDDKLDAIVTDQRTRATVSEDYFIDKGPGTIFGGGFDELHPSGGSTSTTKIHLCSSLEGRRGPNKSMAITSNL